MIAELVLMTRIGGRVAAIRAQDIQSVIELERMTPVPGAPPHIIGLTALRSQALTVVDCRMALGLGSSVDAHENGLAGCQAIVIENEGHPYALVVDEASDVTASQSDILPLSGDLGAGWHRVAEGLIETQQGPALLVNASGLIAGKIAEAA